ncbi:hypothetical protein DE146DRAFT_642852 [Phaeosphaeria sp. MPI-PUGE-AT-0046c]|nr:hypothetical protein DE146DRAFT_642852 [Phaeosphaeria sp. MPI-PUGE-AT-0046c]
MITTTSPNLYLAFSAGKSAVSDPNLIQVSHLSKTLQYNRTFTNPPDNQTNAAWHELYPRRGTFFTHAPEAPQRSTLSVFHQIHCLDGIRHAYWQSMNAALEGKRLHEKDIPMMSSPSHMRHCIDLLRQSLMCNADRTIEVKDDKGDVLGFGTTHKCVDWSKMIRKIEEWNGVQ